MPLVYQEKLRNASGVPVDTVTIHKFGFNPDIGTTIETVWDKGGLYVYPTVAVPMVVSSSSTADEAASSGARTVDVYGLDGSFDEVVDRVTMNGVDGVSTIRSFIRVTRVIVRTAGGSGSNESAIYVSSAASTDGVPTGDTYAQVSSGENQTLMSLWTVPSGKNFYIQGFNAQTEGNSAQIVTIRLVARPDGEVFQTKDKVLVHQSQGHHVEFTRPLLFEEKTDFEVRAASDAGTMDVEADFWGFYGDAE